MSLPNMAKFIAVNVAHSCSLRDDRRKNWVEYFIQECESRPGLPFEDSKVLFKMLEDWNGLWENA